MSNLAKIKMIVEKFLIRERGIFSFFLIFNFVIFSNLNLFMLLGLLQA